jgi:hypothetical protein
LLPRQDCQQSNQEEQLTSFLPKDHCLLIFVTGKTLFLRRMSIFQRRLFARRMTYYTAFLQCYCSVVSIIDGNIRRLLTSRRNKEENGNDNTGC